MHGRDDKMNMSRADPTKTTFWAYADARASLPTLPPRIPNYGSQTIHCCQWSYSSCRLQLSIPTSVFGSTVVQVTVVDLSA